ncbi:MoxR family ATPase [Micromonospora ureilytica]|uniref:MoxR family ATPase n=1 Tax=Micromonospora ureilytica TaxID=709868 RepID=UPI0033C98379
MTDYENWRLYTGTSRILDPEERDRRWPPAPRWRTFAGGPDEPPPPDDDPDGERRLGRQVISDNTDERIVDLVNVALRLRRPLLVVGRPGSGRSSLAYRIARELGLGRVLRWPLSTQSSLRAGLYDFDAIGLVRAANRRSSDGPAGADIGDHVRLGPVGTALLPYRLPRVLLIDELDQSDIELPQQLRAIFEDGGFDIPELVRAAGYAPEVTVHTADPGRTAVVRSGQVTCHEFPLIVMTCAEERDFPLAFLRHCLRLRMPEADRASLGDMIAAHFPDDAQGSTEIVEAYLRRRGDWDAPAIDQLLDAVHLRASDDVPAGHQPEWERIIEALWHRLPPAEPQ